MLLTRKEEKQFKKIKALVKKANSMSTKINVYDKSMEKLETLMELLVKRTPQGYVANIAQEYQVWCNLKKKHDKLVAKRNGVMERAYGFKICNTKMREPY